MLCIEHLLGASRREERHGENGSKSGRRGANHGLQQPRRDHERISGKSNTNSTTETGKNSVRERDLPPHVVMYYVIAQALFMQVSARKVLRRLLEGVRWLFGPKTTVKVTGKSGISQTRSRLGWEPVKQLHDEVVEPIAVKKTRGAWSKRGKLVSLDGSTLNVADTKENQRCIRSARCQ